jgi:hypothetical protein
MVKIRKSLIPFAWIAVLLIVIYAGCSSDDNNGTNPPPGPTTGTLVISSTPTGAAITIDDSAMADTTPATFTEVDVDSHTIKLQKSAYDDWDTTVYVAAGDTVEVDPQLVLTMYTLSVYSAGHGLVYQNSNGTPQLSYLPGTEVEILAVPDDRYGFEAWTGQYASTKNPDTVTMTQNWTTTATFTEVQPVWDSIRIEGTVSLPGGDPIVHPFAFLDTSFTEYVGFYRGLGWEAEVPGGNFVIQFDPRDPQYGEPLDSFEAIITAWDDINENLTPESGEPVGWWDVDGDGEWNDYVMLHRGDTLTNVNIVMTTVFASSGRIPRQYQIRIK